MRITCLKRICHLLVMLKIMSLIVGGIFLMAMGLYAINTSNIQFPSFTWPEIDTPDVNWAVVGFVAIVGGLISTGMGVVASRVT